MKVIVTCRDVNLQQIVPKLEREGFVIDSVLDAIGMVTGDVDPQKLPDLKKISGISIEPDLMVQLPPPDSALQ